MAWGEIFAKWHKQQHQESPHLATHRGLHTCTCPTARLASFLTLIPRSSLSGGHTQLTRYNMKAVGWTRYLSAPLKWCLENASLSGIKVPHLEMSINCSVAFVSPCQMLCCAFYTGHTEVPREGAPHKWVKVSIKYFNLVVSQWVGHYVLSQARNPF